MFEFTKHPKKVINNYKIIKQIIGYPCHVIKQSAGLIKLIVFL